MQRITLEVMQEQVRSIYRALTGNDLPESVETRAALPLGVESEAVVTQRFIELEGWARMLPGLAERIPPFAFSPPLDASETEKEVRLDVALPGVPKEDVHIELRGDVLILSGHRVGDRPANGRASRHAEIPRGPFRRLVLLPQPVAPQPRVDAENGIIRIHMTKLPMGSVAQA
jgi:HSP20 family molecular chaperone IbpA